MSLVDTYLKRLEMVHPATASVEYLFEIHRRHVERVSWQSIDIFAGRPQPTAVKTAMKLIASGRSGYCFHLNGAFAGLLRELGFVVDWHRAGVQSHGRDPIIDGFHVGLSAEVEGERWVLDVGLGDMPWEPLPMAPGRYSQGPFTYEVTASQRSKNGWRLVNDSNAAFVRVDVDGAIVPDLQMFEDHHRHLSRDSHSPWVNLVVVRNREQQGSNELKGCYFTRRDVSGAHMRIVEDQREWFELLSDVFYEPLWDYDGRRREALWRAVIRKHEEWVSLGNR